jgi:methylglyoxal synthase
MKKSKNIALVAHDNRKKDLLEWVEFNYKTLLGHHLICTGTTGKMVEDALIGKLETSEYVEHPIVKLKSGPLGGDQQLGSLIADGKVDMLIFFWDPMQPQPHDVDVKALLRITVVYNIPTACNRSTADFMISSHLLKEDYHPILVDYSRYIQRSLE